MYVIGGSIYEQQQPSIMKLIWSTHYTPLHKRTSSQSDWISGADADAAAAKKKSEKKKMNVERVCGHSTIVYDVCIL